MTSSIVPNTFEYLIVGGGTAGLVLAARLTEDPNTTVGVIEAGEDWTTHPDFVVPGKLHCHESLASLKHSSSTKASPRRTSANRI